MSVSMIPGHSPYSRAGNLNPPKVALQESPIRFQVNPVTAMTCWRSLAISPRPRGLNPSGSEFIACSTISLPSADQPPFPFNRASKSRTRCVAASSATC